MNLRNLVLSSILLVAGGTSLTPAKAFAQATRDNPAQVMVLGVYHFNGGGRDLINPEVEDHLSDNKQAEIAALLDSLEEFAPTKIMVELTPEHEAAFNENYQNYLDGNRTLGVNERQQIGMRLAERLGHDWIHAVDFHHPIDFGSVMQAAEESGENYLIEDFQSQMGDVQAFMTANETLNVTDRIIQMNSPFMDEFHGSYLTLARMGSTDNPVGAQQMTSWWHRNMVIFTQTADRAEPGDRILLIFGSGHKHLLDYFFDHDPAFERVDPLDYLE